jgi:hypothetical protein
MHAKHADEPSALIDLWLGPSKTAMALRAFVLAPANIWLPAAVELTVGSGPYLEASWIIRRASQADAVGAVWPGAHAKRHICFPNSPLTHGQVNMLVASACFVCIAFPYLRLKFLLACLIAGDRTDADNATVDSMISKSH